MPRLPGLPGSRAARDPRDTSDAPTTTSYRDAAVTLPPSPVDTITNGARVGRQASVVAAPRRELAMERRAVVAVVALVAGILGAGALSRSISDVIETRAQVADAQALNEAIRAQVEAGRREVAFAQGVAYRRFAARGLGYGRGREEAFALRDGAPPPPSITPLGAGQAAAGEDVLGSFVELLLEP